jgi:hypothetical protein
MKSVFSYLKSLFDSKVDKVTGKGLSTNDYTDADATALQNVVASDQNKAPTSHASSSNTYGIGTSSNYGHVKTKAGDLNGETAVDGVAAASSHTHSQYAENTGVVHTTGNESIAGNKTFSGDINITGNFTVDGEPVESSNHLQNGQVIDFTDRVVVNDAIAGYAKDVKVILEPKTDFRQYNSVIITHQGSAAQETFTVSFNPYGGTYGGILDVTKGVYIEDKAYIASYNGETIGEPWISSLDEYVPGTLPSIGAKVIYTTSTTQTLQVRPTDIKLYNGYNVLYADCGDTYLEIYSVGEADVDIANRAGWKLVATVDRISVPPDPVGTIRLEIDKSLLPDFKEILFEAYATPLYAETANPIYETVSRSINVATIDSIADEERQISELSFNLAVGSNDVNANFVIRVSPKWFYAIFLTNFTNGTTDFINDTTYDNRVIVNVYIR